MKQGSPLLPFSLKDAYGKLVSSDDYAAAELFLLVFTCNHCPYAKASWPLLAELQNRFQERGLQVIAINPNNNPNYPDDRFEEMAPFAEKNNIHFPYLFDADQSVARAYGAQCTPDPFLFQKGRLFYHGRLNDNWQAPEKVKEKSMELHVLAALGEGQRPESSYPSMGCSIKWVTQP